MVRRSLQHQAIIVQLSSTTQSFNQTAASDKKFFNLCWKIASAWSLFGIVAFVPTPVFAQSAIAPDNTLGAENSNVVTNFNGSPIEVITGGATRGINLFHSFREFNVSQGREAYFFSPSADIQNILARVTGSNRSEILGKLGTSGNSQPNLFLINPNGIIFGEKASLNVQGSFVATTANGVQFENQGSFNATNPQAAPLLTVNPSALLFNQINQGGIINRSRELATLGSFYLIGGDITFDGGFASSLGNSLELGAVAGTGNVELIGSGNQMQLAFPDGVPKADIFLQNNAFALTIRGGAITVNAGNIQLETRSLTLTNGGNIGTQSSGIGSSGNLLVNASDSVTLSGITTFIDPQTGETSTTGSRLTTSALGTRNSGQLTINTQRLSISDGGDITTRSSNLGHGGDLTINAKDYVEVLGGSPTGRSTISTSTLGSGDAGSMRINAGRLSIRDGGLVSTSTLGKGKGGNLTVNADRSVELIGTSIDGRFFSALAASAESRSSGNAGDLTITTSDLLVQDGAQVSTGTFDTGKGGNLFVNASNKVELIGISTNGRTISALGASAQTGSSGNAGNLTIET